MKNLNTNLHSISSYEASYMVECMELYLSKIVFASDEVQRGIESKIKSISKDLNFYLEDRKS